MQNLVVHITLPKGMRTIPGGMLTSDVTFDVIGQLNPFFASVQQVRYEGGMYLNDVPDFTVAAAVYQNSLVADSFCSVKPAVGTPAYDRYTFARNNWVTAAAALDLLMNTQSLRLIPGAHVLGNFSVTRAPQRNANPGDNKAEELRKTIKMFDPVLKSCGLAMPGSHVKPLMAAKGVNDWAEKTPARTWVVTGMGANGTSIPFSATGGRGKSYQMFLSPPMSSFRTGFFQGSFSLPIMPFLF